MAQFQNLQSGMFSSIRYVLSFVVVLTQPTIAQESTCNYIGLVKCFINILDEWAWTLYELKDNVVTITSDQCAHLRELDKCIKYSYGTEIERLMNVHVFKCDADNNLHKKCPIQPPISCDRNIVFVN
ncbi:hypothetical protein DICVIV_09455 [Dictyocaulus viviparus]|uniref:Uncharacterized protein n=1 Tax=Dictyocaulus viviparus TaxID=29172 RepID=A0A0D8XL30_DICVI|nr:hypothetical protein DICVIV_09455 [Dictyocaulus viviparus]